MYLISLSLIVAFAQVPKQLSTLATLACGEAGGVKSEAERVLRVVYNRSIRRNTTPYIEATRPFQFYLKGCKGKHKNWLKNWHFRLALATLSGTIEARESQINSPKVTYFATKKRLGKPHPRCIGYTIRDVWTFSGLKPVLKTEVGHVFFKQARKYRPGCPTIQNE